MKYAKKILLFLIPLFVCCIGSVAVFIRSPSTSTRPGEITDLDQYADVLASFEGYTGIHHFPLTIPKNTSEASFYYLPRLFQGGTILQLRLKMPQSEIASERAKFTDQSTYPIQSDSFDPAIPRPSLAAGTATRSKFPETFEIIVLGAEDAGNKQYSWNHGEIFGIAIDEINSEIVYWYEWW